MSQPVHLSNAVHLCVPLHSRTAACHERSHKETAAELSKRLRFIPVSSLHQTGETRQRESELTMITEPKLHRRGETAVDVSQHKTCTETSPLPDAMHWQGKRKKPTIRDDADRNRSTPMPFRRNEVLVFYGPAELTDRRGIVTRPAPQQGTSAPPAHASPMFRAQ